MKLCGEEEDMSIHYLMIDKWINKSQIKICIVIILKLHDHSSELSFLRIGNDEES